MFPILAEHVFILTRYKNGMSITTTKELRNSHAKQLPVDKAQISKETTTGIDFRQQLTVSAIIKTMLEIINIKKSHGMDEETRKQFPKIAKEIILLAEQTQ